MPKIFDTVRNYQPKRSAFDLSHERKLSAKFGLLYPILVEEVVPGDRFSISTEAFTRVAPMISPVMHRIDQYIHYFYVPNRILWPDFDKFITGDLNTVVPHYDLNLTTPPIGGLADHLGIPPRQYATVHEDINALPFRAYWTIWNEYYRDQDLQTAIDIATMELSNENCVQAELLRRCWEKDYFTSARPYMQKTAGPVVVDVKQYFNQPTTIMNIDGTNQMNETLSVEPAGVGNTGWLRGTTSDKDKYVLPHSALNVEMAELRIAMRMQEFLERKARSGSRYAEWLLSFFGVKSSDSRLQRPEYIGGGRQPIVISEVLNTNGRADTDPDALPQGNMSGHGLSVGNLNKAFKFVPEHGWIIGLLSVIPKSSYDQGLHRKFSRSLYTDYLIPQFATLSEQMVKGKEVMCDDDENNNEFEFGYQGRYSEYKFGQSTVHGDFRSTMDHWHLGRKFAGAPTLNSAFVQCDPSDRIFAVQDGTDYLWIQLMHRIKAIRPLPFFDEPAF